MSTPKHTPGPWHVGLKPGPMVYGPQGEQIVGINVMLDRDEVLANAKFIAAAPAMYEALSSSTRWLCRVLPYLPDMVAKEVAKQNHANMAALAQAGNKP